MKPRRSRFGLVVLFALASCTSPLDLGENGVVRPARLPVAGPRTGCFLHETGILRCFGAGGDGQLGRDGAQLHWDCGTGDRCQAEPILFPTTEISDVALGDRFTCVLANGHVQCAGSNATGALARGATDVDPHAVPLAAELVGTFVALAAGRHHVCAIRDDGTVACWGVGNHGALGVDPATLADCGLTTSSDAARYGLPDATTIRCASSAVDVPGIDDAVALVTGPFATCIERANGAYACFGRNVDGSLGIGPTASSVVTTPTPLALAARDVALGERHGCLVDPDGKTFCFGDHDLGQLGLGSSAGSTCGAVPCAPTPTRVIDLATAVAIEAGDAHTCVLLADHSLACFGSDEHGQLGNSEGAVSVCGAIACATRPVAVVGATDVAAFSLAGDHALLVTAASEPMGFGSNVFRESASNNASDAPWASTIYGVAP